MRNLINYLRELSRKTLTTAIFFLGLLSTTATFVPGFGLSPLSPNLLRYAGITAMVVAFVVASYRLHVAGQEKITQLNTQVEELRSSTQKPAPVAQEPDEDILRKALLKYYKERPSPIARYVGADWLVHDLGWPIERVEGAALKATGDFGALKISFDGRSFLLERVPI